LTRAFLNREKKCSIRDSKEKDL